MSLLAAQPCLWSLPLLPTPSPGKPLTCPCPQPEPQGGGCQAGGAVEGGLSAPQESRGQGRQHWCGLQTPGS